MYKIAILGAGAISDSHIQAYLKFPERCRIMAVVDLYPDKATEKSAKHGLAVRVFKTPQDLLDHGGFDAASVCLPPFEHASVSVALLRAGKHVLVEKPMAPSLEECDAMISAAQAGHCQLSVVAQNRFKTPLMKLKCILDSGLIGKVLHAQVDSFWWRGSNYYDLWWRGTWAKEGGGCTMNHAVHHIDLFQWMLGLPAELQAVTLNLAHENSEVEDFSTAILRYPNGSTGQITASLVHHGEEQQLVFQGERAKVSVPWQIKAMKQLENGFPQENPDLMAEIQARYDQLPATPLEGHDGQIANFLAALEGREPLLVDGQQGRRTLELITAIYQSGHLEQKVKLPLTPSDPFYSRDGILKTARRFHHKTKNVENFARNEITLGINYGR
jgi:UDP-N-acetyl-2-amino-2-deoxyglucuronate dehydrogenase